ncbi:hypothetical protein Tco_0758075 [Tanacetum coccineum]
MITEPSGTVKSPSMDAELAIVDSETKSDEVVTSVNKETDASNRELTKINAGVQDEGQAGSNPCIQNEGQAGSNPGNAVKFQPQPSHVVHAGPNLEPMDLVVSDASTQQNPKQMDEEFTTIAYPNFFVEKQQDEEPKKTNVESEVQLMVTVLIHQDTSSVPPMTTPVIDLTTSQSDSPLPTSTTTTTIITTTTTTTLPPPPPQPQQSTTYPIIVQRIGTRLKIPYQGLYNNRQSLSQGQFGNQRTLKKIRVWGAREEKLGRQVLVQQNVDTGAFNCKGFGHYAKEYRKPKRVKDYTYHKEKMMMCKQAEQGVLHSRASCIG